MEIKLSNKPGLDDKGYFKYAEETASFFQTMRNPSVLSPQEVIKAREWLVSLVVVPDKEDEIEYRNKAREVIGEYSFNELIEIVTVASEPDPK